VRYKIWPKEEPAFGIAGLWKHWPDGTFFFTMLTVNADVYPVMNRMHAPGKERRSVAIAPPAQWSDWLGCHNPEVARSFLGGEIWEEQVFALRFNGVHHNAITEGPQTLYGQYPCELFGRIWRPLAEIQLVGPDGVGFRT
jgi:putative SOS response-associated peptidase YedK